jgi:hypothetical protein
MKTLDELLDETGRVDLPLHAVENGRIALERMLTELEPEPKMPIAKGNDRRRTPRRVVVVRWAAIPAATAVVTALAITLPGGSQTASAFATWQAEPSPLTGSDLAAVRAACDDQIAAATSGLAADGSPITLTDPTITVTERRGDWAFISFQGTAGEIAMCLTYTQHGAPTVAVLNLADSGGTHTQATVGNLEGAVTIGWGAGGTVAPDVGSQDVVWLQGVNGEFVGSGTFTMIAGVVGSDVRDVVIHANAGQNVTASVTGGHFAAWWPTNDGHNYWQPAQQNGAGEAVMVPDGMFVRNLTVGLADGTVITDAPLTGTPFANP